MAEVSYEVYGAVGRFEALIQQRGLQETMTVSYKQRYAMITIEKGDTRLEWKTDRDSRISAEHMAEMRCCILRATHAGCPEDHEHCAVPDDWLA